VSWQSPALTPGNLVRGDRGADAGAADEDPALAFTRAKRVPDLARLVGIVDGRLRRVRAEVDGIVAAVADDREHPLAELHSPVIERDHDSHAHAPSGERYTRRAGPSAPRVCAARKLEMPWA
jgi:hypothetical protein